MERASGAASELRIGGGLPLSAYDADLAARRSSELAERAAETGCDRLADWLRSARVDARLAAVWSLSPHLFSIAHAHPDWLQQLFDEDAGARVEAIIAGLAVPVMDGASEAEVMTQLRRAKAEASLLVALRDLLGAATPDRTCRDLSALAQAAVGHAIRFLALDLDRRGALQLPDRADPERGLGLFALGMGKLGGAELNYSSDIDLILFFDPDAPAVMDPADSVETFGKLARRLVRMIGERTREGYVFRTDLRLRPDPSAMPLAIPLPAALVYYEGSGRDWERAAMIKARVVAGDREAGAAFLQEITPFVWRRYLDFVAIRDIRNMKARIDQHRGFTGIEVAGHNLKLGRGGIREIEFFAQAQQLIAGGRAPRLRTRRTDEALEQLAASDWIDAEVAAEMTRAYWFLRRAEHAVQMIADEQTHTLPDSADALETVARLCNQPDAAHFASALTGHLERVERRFSALFADGRDDDATDTFGDDDATRERLAALGYRRPADMARILGGWTEGRLRATRSEAAREPLGRVLPRLLQSFAAAPDPDSALAEFDRFLAGLPAGLQFFSLIASNPRLLDLLTLIVTSAPELGRTITARPHVFDALLEPAFFRDVPGADARRRQLAVFLAEATSLEERLVRLRIFASEGRFLIGVRLLSGAIEGPAAGEAFTTLAEVVIEAVLDAVLTEFMKAHGEVAGGRVAVLGLGRLGSRELTASSDVDLMLLYDHDEGAEESDGPRPLPVSTYYMRLTQRLIAALSAPMAEGLLYAVDFRLRPSGNKGPLATHIDAFRRYQAEAWTWERMALTRSHPVAGNEALQVDIVAAIRETIAAHRDDPLLSDDVADMRARLDVQKPARGLLDLKRLPGGLTDLEFLAQWAILTGRAPLEAVGRPTGEVLRHLRPEDRAGLALEPSDAMERLTRLVQLLRLGTGTANRVADLPLGLARRIASSLDLAEPAAIETEVADTARGVREMFSALLPFDPKLG
ncbi:bifunctional [glutamine synthetase] adenylyltransferase/[glutamine synthetase]-adenylyl-L-tyrosine phosphorylase [Aureimonas jatrophae]|uniref:Bifunctional glutamine synthetase adenylyltransferase/adenylyl-removing enzyme n=1 Tax=Aureimonas jatrophae TaxID=1166073 RepID=A0A1H0CRL1_9HYPH|nr:bifunctional [glutamine synthetase] adenylyltransferase/[glutamine synthetase]-adenylyl-L-tyrosine phosphorylase [Aureimonas jatrophae]MBB3949353.1 glutamate-ammonia-ligase adenylyltransferase [Aureimonas jatrophae]SDN60465.1 glutamate-ammonia-ligase adenylyltransferase [Aureimonas jatrophae]